MMKTNRAAKATRTAAAAIISTDTETTEIDVQTEVKERIENVTQGLPSNCFSHLSDMALAMTGAQPVSSTGKGNALTICDYVSSMKSEINASDHYRKDVIILLCNLWTFFNNNSNNNNKSFKEIIREDLLSFPNSYRKTEDVDPSHKWIGTYNLYRVHLMRFFKWLYSPGIEPDKRACPIIMIRLLFCKKG